MKKKIAIFALIFFVLSHFYPETINEILSEKNFKIGMIRFYNREYEAAIQLFSKALSFQPLNHKARYYLGYAYLNSGYAKNAIDEWENLIKLGGGNYQVKQKLNDLYFRLSIDKSYDYSYPYVFSKLYNGLEQGMHKIDRPSFIIYDEKRDSMLISSTKTRYVVEIDGSGKLVRSIGRKPGEFSDFKMPTGLYIYDDKIYIADYKADSIFIFNRDGKYLNKFGTRGIGSTNIAGPMGIYISPDEYLFIVDNGNDRIQKFDLKGEWIQSIGEGLLKRPTDVAGQDNIIYVTDTMNKRVLSFDTFGNLLETIGENTLKQPRGIFLKNKKLYISDAEEGLFIYDTESKTLEKFNIDKERVHLPFDVCLDSKNLIYETDFNTQNIAIFNPLQLQYANIGVQIPQIWLGSYPHNAIHLMVWDKAGEPIYNLKEDNIQLYEEGTLIPIIRLGSTYELRKNLYAKIIIDKSLPMQENDPELLEILNAFLGKTTGNDWLDIIVVNDKTESSGKIQSSVLWPIEFIKKIPYKNSFPEALDKCIHQSIRELLNINRNKVIILLTGGETGNSSFGTYDPDMLLTYARQNAIPIYIINFRDKNKEIFQKLAEETFGKYYTIRDLKSILNLYDEIKNSPPLEYIVTYEGLNLKGLRNFWVNVHIKVKYKELFGVDDTGYFVPEMFIEKDLLGREREIIKEK